MSSIINRLSSTPYLALAFALLPCLIVMAFLVVSGGAVLGTPAGASLVFLLSTLPVALWVAWSDMAEMKIPNKAVLAMLGIFLIIGAVALPLDVFLWRWMHFAVVLAIGFVLTLGGVFGAGDSKFAAAMAPFVALHDVTFVLLIFAVAVIFGFVTHRLARAIPAIRSATSHWESWERTKEFPMGYPLAVTLVLYLAMTAF